MKIAISAVEPDLDSDVDPRFGRSQYFILVEPHTMKFETFRNPNLESPTGAGIGAAQLICDKGAGTVITGNIGPKAHQALSAAGVRILTGVSGKVRQAIQRFKAGELASETGLSADSAMGAGGGMGPGMRAGGGRGRGMGSGMGRGMGRGMGCGGGKGMGIGSGRGGGGRPLRDREAEPLSDRQIKPDGQDELTLLKQQAEMLADELTRTRQRIEEMENK